MKKILLCGDPHFKVSNPLEYSQFISEFLQFLNKNIDEISFVVLLGDILDTHERIHMKPFCSAISFIEEISYLKKVFVLIGNHDRYNNKVFMTDEHGFNGLKEKENIFIVDKTLRYKKFLFVPYVPPGRFREAIKDYDLEDINCIFAHQEFRGCKMNTIISETGDKWSLEDPPVFSGHIHNYHIPQENIIYVGTPFQQTFDESEDKAVMLLNLKDRKFSFERHFLNIIKKRRIFIKIEDLKDIILDSNILWKIIIEGDPEIIKDNLKNKDLFNKLMQHNVRYEIKNNTFKHNRDLNIVRGKKYNFENKLREIIKESDEDIRKEFDLIFKF